MKRAISGAIAIAIFCIGIFIIERQDSAPLQGAEMEPQGGRGTIEVEILAGGRWHPAGSLAFDEYLRGQTLEVPEAREVERVRLTRRGGGAAHIDHFSLDGAGPVWTSCGTKKLTAADRDVVALGESFEAAFPPGAGLIEVVARIEPKVISKVPFGYPRGNTGRRVDTFDIFHEYELGSRPGRLKVDGELADESLGQPFFTDSQIVGSGHPQGTTYGWVKDDGERLYVAIDFTPDNTDDGGLDYAKVIARASDGARVFRVSTEDRQWGSPGFTYTDKVGYQHMVYEFEIPLEELEIASAGDGAGTIELAFAAYGTAHPPAVAGAGVAHSLDSDRYLVARYLLDDGEVYRDVHDGAGQEVERTISISEDPELPAEWKQEAAVAYGKGRFLVVWEGSQRGYSRIAGRLFDSAGAAETDVFTIVDTEVGSVTRPAAAANPETGEFLVAFRSSNGFEAILLEVSEGGVEVGEPVSLPADGWRSRVAHGDDRYLLTWSDGHLGEETVSALFLTGRGLVDGEPFELAEGSDNSVAFDEQHGAFVVTWRAADREIAARTVGPDGALGEIASLELPDHRPYNPAAAYQPLLSRTLIAYQAHPVELGPSSVRRALFDAETATFSDDEQVAEVGMAPNVAANVELGNFGIAFDVTWESPHEFVIHGEPIVRHAVSFETDGTEGAMVAKVGGEPVEALRLLVHDGEDAPKVSAIEPDGYRFIAWTHGDAVVTTEPTVLIEDVTEDVTVVAAFAPSFTVTFETDGTEGASIDGDVQQSVLQGEATEPVTAGAPDGYGFIAWTHGDEVVGAEATVLIEDVTEDMVVVASFAPLFTVTFETDGTEGASIDGDVHQSVLQGEATEPVTAGAPQGHRFLSWSSEGDVVGVSPSIVIEDVGDDMTVVASFGPIFTVTFETDGTEGASIDGEPEQQVAEGGSTEAVTAVAPEGHLFDAWTYGDEVLGDQPDIIVETVMADMTVVANFSEQPGEPDEPEAGGCGCSTGGTSASGLVLAGAVLLLTGLTRRRRPSTAPAL